MCGRVVQKKFDKAEPDFGKHIGGVGPLADRYNLAPTQDALTVHQAEAGLGVALRRWGLIPSWAKDPSIGVKLINARAETVPEKPSFRSAFRKSRIVIPVHGFYEWAVIAGKKRPYFIHPADGGRWMFAGLAESWRGPDGPVETFTIVTTGSNRAMSELHDRMPVILGPGDWQAWLDPTTPAPQLQALLKPCPDAWLEAWEVGPAVGNTRNDGPDLILPVAG